MRPDPLDLAVRALIDRAFARATEILQERREALCAIAQRLLEKETLSGSELKDLLESAMAALSPAHRQSRSKPPRRRVAGRTQGGRCRPRRSSCAAVCG